MSRGVTLATGRGKSLVLIAAAMLLASLFTVATSAVAPSRVLAGNCNSIVNPVGADGVTVSFTNANGNVATGDATTATTYYDSSDGKYYAQAVDGTASATNSMMAVLVTYGGSRGSDPWCIFQGDGIVKQGNGYNLRGATDLYSDELPATDASSATFTAIFDLADYNLTSGVVCVGARVSGREGSGGAPKGSACLTIAAHSVSGEPTPTPSASVGGVTSPPTDTAGAVSGRVPMLGLILLVLAAIAGLAGLLTPASKRIRR